ncbi:MAG TPA: cbb3-type cytochrome c oxidase subunit I [Acidimicrobiales bacterium]|jgi:cytochrome c oxidase subunit 1|nr:cbb3-type cytochrome c oxidase subunit I [Acidimicrobiales bacterium]HJM32014.1 cbb3-type cytochrome c oxidase subunit I [Acidimicrobiales bacterium]|tara:strand:+ start:529 stop:2370 length:1842 start_codon:yes stop_codon:yes gene_type:complete
MRQLLRAVIFGILGYLVGATLTWLVRGGSLGDEVCVVFGYVVGLIGWLFGIGMGDTWVREWFGRPASELEVTGWKRYLGFSTDHKVIGIQYMVTFLVVLLLGGVAAMVMRLELAQAGEGILSADRYNQVMSMHGILMIAVAVAAILGSFGNYLVPIMIGADDMAFPRLNAVTFWLIPPVAIGLLAAPTLGSFDTGWTAYPPLSVINNSGQILFVLAVTTFGLSSILGGLNVVTTIVTMRAPGMTWGRLPIFVWAAFSASVLSLLVTQFFAASLVLIAMDRVAGTVFFDGGAGGDPLLYQHLFWFYSHPAVYVMVLPAFGVVLEVITHMARKPLFAYKAVVVSLLTIAGLSVIVWAHHMFTSGMATYLHGPFMFATEMISVPTGVIFLSAVATLWQGRLWMKTPLLFAMIWVFQFLMGGVTGIFLADVATDVQLHDTYFVVAHFHYTIMGGMLFAFLAGIFFWFPKITGRMINDRLGIVFALWLTVGFQITFLPQFWLGTNGMNRRIADYPEQLEGANLFSSISSFLLGASFLLLVYILVSGARRGPVAGPNPWNASTLEWQVSSPPPEHNFSGQPRVVDHPYVYGTAGSRHAEFVGVTTTREQAEDRNGDHDG